MFSALRPVLSILKLSRFDTSLLIALSVFLPTYFSGNTFDVSVYYSLPMLLIGMCAFVVNDIDDVESDKINHPERPLPSQAFTVTQATLFYFSALISTFFLINYFAPKELVHHYYMLLVCVVSYKYVTSHMYLIKPVYVSIITLFPVFIASQIVFQEVVFDPIFVSLFLFVLGRELLMDILDRKGDSKSLITVKNAKLFEGFAIFIQCVALVCIVNKINALMDFASYLILVTLHCLALYVWFRKEIRTTAILIMKFELFVGLYFLFN